MSCLVLKTRIKGLQGRFCYPHFVDWGTVEQRCWMGGPWSLALKSAHWRFTPRRGCVQYLCSWPAYLTSCSADPGLSKLKHSPLLSPSCPREPRNFSDPRKEFLLSFLSLPHAVLKDLGQQCTQSLQRDHIKWLWFPGIGGSPVTWADGLVWLGFGVMQDEPIPGESVGSTGLWLWELMNEPAAIVSLLSNLGIKGRERSAECIFSRVNRIFPVCPQGHFVHLSWDSGHDPLPSGSSLSP